MQTIDRASRTILFDYPIAAHQERVSTAQGQALVSPCCVGRCLHADDPLGTGRVLVAYSDAMCEENHHWLAPLADLVIERDDELLLLEPRGSREPIVAGILTRRHPRPTIAPTSLALAPGESFTITAHAPM